MKTMKRFFANEDGQTVVEYALLVSLIAIVCIAIMVLLGRRNAEVFNVAQNALEVPAEATPVPTE
jgi:pilus assembly protein Flp/PilA